MSRWQLDQMARFDADGDDLRFGRRIDAEIDTKCLRCGTYEPRLRRFNGEPADEICGYCREDIADEHEKS